MKKQIQQQTKLQVLVADDHPLFRKGLIQAINVEQTIEIVGEVGDGKQALQTVEELKPDIIVLDIEMPSMNGLEVAREIIKRKLPVDIVILTMYKEEDIFNEAMDLGVKGYVLKESAVSDIVQSIKTVANGRYYLSPSISEFLVNRSDRARTLLKKRPQLENLTTTERKVLRLISSNKTSKEIADDLHISYRTVENHRSNICNKLEIHGSHALLKFAIENKSLL
jgi:DNA-binding NarL/FixJ family response regulator